MVGYLTRCLVRACDRYSATFKTLLTKIFFFVLYSQMHADRQNTLLCQLLHTIVRKCKTGFGLLKLADINLLSYEYKNEVIFVDFSTLSLKTRVRHGY